MIYFKSTGGHNKRHTRHEVKTKLSESYRSLPSFKRCFYSLPSFVAFHAVVSLLQLFTFFPACLGKSYESNSHFYLMVIRNLGKTGCLSLSLRELLCTIPHMLHFRDSVLVRKRLYVQYSERRNHIVVSILKHTRLVSVALSEFQITDTDKHFRLFGRCPSIQLTVAENRILFAYTRTIIN